MPLRIRHLVIALTIALAPAAFAQNTTTDTPATAADSLAGLWRGPILLPGDQKLPLTLRLRQSADGKLTATSDSPAQGAFGMPVSSVSFKNGKLRFALAHLGASYEGTLNPATEKFEGTFSQNGFDAPLTLTRVSTAPDAPLNQKNPAPAARSAKPKNPQDPSHYPERPQTPKGPFPYREQQVSFKNPDARINLSGTLTVPAGPGPFPALILINGSGAHTRDCPLFGHRSFLVLADHFTRQGYAVLRYDERGTGKSGGKFSGSTVHDLTTDARAAFQFLQKHPDIAPARILLLGHSEGGQIAPLVAAQEPAVAGLILLAAPGLPMREIIPQQKRVGQLALDLPVTPHLEKILRFDQATYDILIAEDDPAAARKKIRAAFREHYGPEADSEAGQKLLNEMLPRLLNPWFIAALRLDPAAALAQVRCPILALNGDKDTQVAAAPNLAALRAALEKSGHTRFTVQTLPDLNHLFQTARTGSSTEYEIIEETFAPSALAAITDWLKKTDTPPSAPSSVAPVSSS